MLRKISIKELVLVSLLFLFYSCADKEDQIVDLDLRKSELIFTEVIGDMVEAHGDHFHGLDNGKLGQSSVLKFDKDGKIVNNNLLKIKPDLAYKVELKTWDENGNEIQNDFIKNKLAADSYKSFLIGGNFVLNTSSENNEGALFQPREKLYSDGSNVDGKYEVTGVLSYFILGKDNAAKVPATITYVLRKLGSGVKSKIERVDWNRSDYKNVFEGEDLLQLTFRVQIN